MPAMAQMNLKDTLLSAISQTQKATYCMTHSCEIPRTGKSLEIESRLVVSRDLGNRRGE